MSLVKSNIADLQKRKLFIQKLLRPISKVDTGPACSINTAVGIIILSAHDQVKPNSMYRDWRFATKIKYFRGNYFEVWKIHKNEVYCLEQAYLNIYMTNPNNRDEREFICLHCDPNESLTAKHSTYKRGPHLHIKAAELSIPKAHIALNLMNLEEVVASGNKLFYAMQLGIKMIDEQILI